MIRKIVCFVKKINVDELLYKLKHVEDLFGATI